MRKKILIATDSFLPRWDGIARFLNEIIPLLSKDYDITVLAPKFPGDFEGYEGVTLVLFPITGMRVGDINLAKPSLSQVKEKVMEADVVFTQTIGPIGAAAIMSAWRNKKPLVSYIHSIEWELFSLSPSFNSFVTGLVSSSTKMSARFLYNKCDLLLVPSRETAELLSWEGIKAHKEVLHLGTDTEKFKPALNKASAKEKLGINPKFKVVGFCGRIGREKNLLTLHRAFLRLRRKHDDAVLLVVGGGVLSIKKMFESKENIISIGSTNNVVPYLQAMDVYVLPSLTETSSLSTMEAMACGVPVVVTPVGYVKEYIKDGFNGYFFEKRDAYALYKKLELLFSDDRTRLEMGHNARVTIEKNFSWSSTIKELNDVFEIF